MTEGSNGAIGIWRGWAAPAMQTAVAIAAIVVTAQVFWLGGIADDVRSTNTRIDTLTPILIGQAGDVASIKGDMRVAATQIENVGKSMEATAARIERVAAAQESLAARMDTQATRIDQLTGTINELTKAVGSTNEQLRTVSERLTKFDPTP